MQFEVLDSFTCENALNTTLPKNILAASEIMLKNRITHCLVKILAQISYFYLYDRKGLKLTQFFIIY